MEGTISNTYTREELQYIASTALKQIIATTDENVFFSWGVNNVTASIYNGLPALVLVVNARLLRGFVIVAFNEGADLYDIYTASAIDEDGDEIKEIATGVYCDQLGDIIDHEIERGDNAEEYEAFCREEEKKLYGEIFS